MKALLFVFSILLFSSVSAPKKYSTSNSDEEKAIMKERVEKASENIDQEKRADKIIQKEEEETRLNTERHNREADEKFDPNY